MKKNQRKGFPRIKSRQKGLLSSELALFAANTTGQESKAEQVGNRHGVPKAVMNFVLKAQYRSFRNFSSSTDSGNYCKKQSFSVIFSPLDAVGSSYPRYCFVLQHNMGNTAWKSGPTETQHAAPTCVCASESSVLEVHSPLTVRGQVCLI